MALRDLEQFSPGHWFYDVGDQLKQHIYRRSTQAFAEGDARRDALQSTEQVIAHQWTIHETLLRGIGGLPDSDSPLNAQITGTVQGEGFRVEKVIFESRPKHYVTANLYLPDNVAPKTPAILFLCGHHGRAKHEPEYQSVCQHFVQAGFVVLAQDPIGQGERYSYYEPSLEDHTVGWGTTEHDHAGAQCLPMGDGIARYFLHDSMRSLDYLCSRPEVDPDRIGLTGNSGGGTQSSLMMMADPRIACAVPGTFIMNRETYLWQGGAQDAEQIWRGFSEAGFDHEDILNALAPKPIRVIAVRSDFFPIEGTRRTVERCKRIWGLFGKEDYIDLVEDDSTHKYTYTLASAATDFFLKHLLQQEPTPRTPHISPFPPEQLWCTKSGQVRADFPDAEFVFEANQSRLREVEAQRWSLGESERRDRAQKWLMAKVQCGRKPAPLNPRFYRVAQEQNWLVEMAIWWSQEDILNHAYVIRDFQRAGESLPVTLALWEGGTNSLRVHYDWISQRLAEGRAVLVLDVSGAGAISPRAFANIPNDAFYGAIHKLSTDLLFLGDDLVSLRVWDVLRALDMIEQWTGLDASEIQLYAEGQEGLYGQLAAFLDPRILGVEVVGGIQSYERWVTSRHYLQDNIYSVILPDVLTYFDLDDLKAQEPNGQETLFEMPL